MSQQQENQFSIQKVADTRIQETAATSRAAAASALVQARCVMALQRPRDWDTVRTKLLKECQRPGFAKAAVYRKPVGGGKKQEGASVRFAEAAMRYSGNIDVQSEVVHEDDSSITLQVTALDLETNAGCGAAVRVQKTVERSSGNGRTVLSKRTNSSGDPVYIVAATEDEMIGKTNSLVSKARRNLIMQLIPGDIVDECKEECQRVYADKAAKDPEATRKAMFDDFSEFGVMPSQIKEYLGHSNPPSVKELEDLRGILVALESKETTWAAITEDQRGESEQKRDAAIAALKEQSATNAQAPKTAAKPTAQRPPGDLLVALEKMRSCPIGDLSKVTAELGGQFAWSDEERATMRQLFNERRNPPVDPPSQPAPNPDEDGR